MNFFSNKILVIIIILFLFFSYNIFSTTIKEMENLITLKKEIMKKHIEVEKAIKGTISWAKEKDTKKLYNIISEDENYLEIHPNDNVVKGISEFRKSEDFWLNPDFKHIGFDISDLKITFSESKDVAWFYCKLNDYNEWKGKPVNWENTRWTGVLELIDNKWKMKQMHFSYAN